MPVDMMINHIEIFGLPDRYQFWLHQAIKQAIDKKIEHWPPEAILRLQQEAEHIRIDNLDIQMREDMTPQKCVDYIADHLLHILAKVIEEEDLIIKGE